MGANYYSECQYNMSFHVQKLPDISNGWSDISSVEDLEIFKGVSLKKISSYHGIRYIFPILYFPVSISNSH